MMALSLLVGAWSCLEPADEWRIRPERYPYAYVPDEALSEVCGDPEEHLLELSPYVSNSLPRGAYVDDRATVHGAVESTPFDGQASALAGVAGTWVLCEADWAPPLVGVQLLADGRWRQLTLEAGQLVAGAGFGQEGPLRAVAIADRLAQASPGSYWLELLPYGLGVTPAAGDPVVQRGGPVASERLLEIGSGAIYLPAALPVLEPGVAYADGERAGVEGCGTSERGIVATAAEAGALLSGDFVLCSGALRDGPAQLHFEGSRVELRRDDGSVLAGDVSLADVDSGLLTVDLPRQTSAARSWNVVLSRAPLKLWSVEVRGRDPVGISLAAERVIWSALP